MTANPLWPADLFHIKTALRLFASGLGWQAGFVMSIIALQTVAVMLVVKMDLHQMSETEVWVITFFPCTLALMGSYRLGGLLCKQQLAHAFLQHGMSLIEPPSSLRFDACLLVLLAIYALEILVRVGISSWAAMTAVLIALGGPAWTVSKALLNARDMEDQLQQVEVERRKLVAKGSPHLPDSQQIMQIPWSHVVAAGRAGTHVTAHPSQHGAAVQGSEFQLIIDVFWHRRTIFGLTGSYAGFLVLPSSVALVSLFLGITVLEAAQYTCSCGQLSNLQLASSLHSLNFSVSQTNFLVQLDTSFKQVEPCLA